MTDTLIEPPPTPADDDVDQLVPAGRKRFRRWVLLGGLAVLIPYLYVLTDLFSGGPVIFRAVGPSGTYTYQAWNMLHGHLWMRPADLNIEAFMHDGRAFTYFGIFPSLLRMPFVAINGTHGNSNYTVGSMFLSWILTGVFTSMLIWRLRIIMRGRVALGRLEAAAYGLLVASILGGSVILYLGAMPWVYNEDFAWSIALTIGVFWGLLGVIDRPSWSRVLTTGGLILLASLNRLTAGWACVIAALAVAVWFWVSSAQRDKRRWVVPVVLIGVIPLIVSCAINYAKFGLPFGLPMADQVWAHVNVHRREFLAANEGKAFSFSFLPSTLNAYLNPLNISISGIWPFVQLPTTLPRIIGSATFDQTYPTSSISVTMPMLFGLGCWGLFTTLRRKATGRVAEVRFILIPAVIGCVGVLLWGYIANRYLADFMPLVIVASAVGMIDVTRRLEGRSRAVRRWIFSGFAAMTALFVLVNVAVAFTPNSAWSKGQLTNFIKDQKVLSVTPLSSKVTVTRHLPTFAPAGEMFATPSCSGLYRSNGENFSDVPGQQLEHMAMSPVEQTPSFFHRLWLTPNIPITEMHGATVLFRVGETKIVAKPVYQTGIAFFLRKPSHPDVTFPGLGGGFFKIKPGKRYAVEIVHDTNTKRIELWWFNAGFKKIGAPVFDHTQSGQREGNVVLTDPSKASVVPIKVTKGPSIANKTHLCEDLTGK
jgi:hypothetical protein